MPEEQSRKKLIDKARKLYALSRQGQGGERDNARVAFSRYIEKHGLSLKEVAGEWREHSFDYINYLDSQLIGQIIKMVLDENDALVWVEKSNRLLFVECTASQAAEIETAYSVWSPALRKELELFLQAFCYKNNIFPPSAPPNQQPQTREELEKADKIRRMLEGADQYEVRKQL